MMQIPTRALYHNAQISFMGLPAFVRADRAVDDARPWGG